MTPLEYISNQVALASPSLSAADTSSALRALGFRASAQGLRQVLSVSSALAPHFMILEKHFPNAKKILKDFQTSNEIQKVLDNLSGLEKAEDPNRKSKSKKYAPFCEAITSKDFKAIDFRKHPPIGELFSFFWLLHSSIHASSGLIVPPKLASLLNVSITLTRSMWTVVEDDPSFGTSWKVSLKGNLSDWFTQASSAIEQASHSNFALFITSQDIKEGFEEARQLISQLKAIQIDQQEIEDFDEPEPRLSEQRGVGLNERERLSCHHNAFQDEEIKTLAKDIRDIIEHDLNTQSPHLVLNNIFPPYYIEASLIALALVTGRTIEGVIKFPLNTDSAEYLESELASGIQRFNYPIWHRNISTKYSLRIPLPSFLKQPVDQLFRFDLAETIEDCLPYSVIDWNTRCLNWLEQNISGSSREINRRVRDALAREIYKSTSSPSLLRIVTTPITDVDFNNESLSHYVNPLDKRTLGAYANACTNMFNKYGAPTNICELLANNEFAVSQAQHRQVAEYFLSQIAAAEQSGNFIAHHNWIARYILMLLIVATGHRKSHTPFFFPWDILIEENLAFLCDKLTVGSEARFVPIPEWLSKLILDYREHLHTLAKHISSSAPHLALQIQHLANGGDLHALHKGKGIPNNSLANNDNSLGFFFTINGKLNGKTIKTSNLEQSYLSVFSGGIGEFRKSAANSLWSSGYSGHQVEAFLGHNGEMHSFGESSAWSISGWANEIRAWQEEYLELRGWKSIQLTPSAAKQSESSVPTVPRLNICGDSYEGRNRDKQQSLDTATKIIRENLPPIWFLDKKSKITVADIRQFREVIKSKLPCDPDTIKVVNLALAREIKKIRKHIGKVQSAIINLTRTEPCPIAIFSSRHYAIASAIRKWWHSQVGMRLDPKSEDVIDRLAEIGISLIIFDALLDKAAWVAILKEITLLETTKAHDCLTVRSQVIKRDRIYEKELILSPPTSALILGFKNKHPAFISSKSTIKDISQRINRRLPGAPTADPDEKLNITNLINVFKPWWQIRLPGAQYSVAIGEHSGPAADTLSECAMYEISCGEPISHKPLVVSARNKTKTNSNPKKAKELFNGFLKTAKGEDKKKNASTRYQRQRLSKSLKNLKSADLVKLSESQQIVLLMLEFLMFLLEEGGAIKDVLRFSAIRTYYSNIQDLIDILWDKNVLDFETEQYDQAYRELIKLSELKTVNLSTPLSRFHQFMRETYHAPPSLVADTFKREPSLCRASLITPAQQENAWRQIGDYVQDDGQIVNLSKNYLYLMYNHAMRNKEAYGIRVKHVIAKNPSAIRIARNATRDLKTGNSFRVTHSMLATAMQERHFNGAVELAKQSPTGNAYLFYDHEQVNRLYSSWAIDTAVTNALRGQTCNLHVVPYSMRHSAATRLAHWAFTSPKIIPLSNHVENALKGSLDEQSIFSCFDTGFTAWPFWIDRVGMYVGHAGVNTLLNTYWHTSSLRLAEHTWLAAENSPITEPQLAKMLGLDRTTVYYQRLRLLAAANPESSDNNKIELLIIHYISKSDIPVIGYYFNEESKFKPAKRTAAISDADVDTTGWIAYDRLLCLRLSQNLNFDQVREVAPTITINKISAQKFIGAYCDIVDETGFTDFEPAGSPLVNGTAKRNKGVTKGADERGRGISAAHRLVKTDDAFAESLNEFLIIWASRVDPGRPWFVARNEREFRLIVDVLLKIGVNETQLGICHYNFDLSRLSKLLTKQQLKSTTVSKTRFSFGHKESSKPEIGIRINQESNSQIGDNRDTHRLALILAAISRTELI